MNGALKNIALDEMLLVKGTTVSAGSRMLKGCAALFDSAVAEKLRAMGVDFGVRARVGEFSIDLLGETSADGALVRDGEIRSASAELLLQGSAEACVGLDVNGGMRRACAQNRLVCVKPTYGSISRHGVVSVVPSGETVSVMARSAGICREVLSALVTHDVRDGTSLSEAQCARVRESGVMPRRIALPTEMLCGIGGEVQAHVETAVAMLRASGAEVISVSAKALAEAGAAWNMILCAELCKSTARYDGVRYGYRAEQYETLDELYAKSRGEGFGTLLKCAILYGSEVLSSENYERLYCKALRVRTLVRECFSRLFEDFDAVLTPAVSKMSYTEEHLRADAFFAFRENFYTAPSSLAGVPAVVAGGVQLIGDSFSEGTLLAVADVIERGRAHEI